MRLQDPSFLEEAQLIDVREPEEVYELRFFTIWAYLLAALISFSYLFIYLFKLTSILDLK